VKLYSYWRSSASWRVRIALHYKQLAFEYIPVSLIEDGGQQLKDAYRAVNPMAQVPTLELPSGERLSQSLAILEYLEETVPTPALLPSSPFARAKARQLAELVNAGIQPLQNTGTIRELMRLGVDAKTWCTHFIETGLGALEQSAQPTSGTFLVGDAPSVADVCLVPQLYNARRYGVDLARFPILSRVEAACMQLPAFQLAHADQQPDAPTT
jgi:maleylpyruvate isomerase